MARQKKVIDASVLIKLFSKEEDSQEAERLLEQHATEEALLIIPELAIIETRNALRFKRLDEKALKIINETLWRLQLHIERMNLFLLDKATQLSIVHNLTIYDATYLAIAQAHGCPLITADKKLAATPNGVLLTNPK